MADLLQYERVAEPTARRTYMRQSASRAPALPSGSHEAALLLSRGDAPEGTDARTCDREARSQMRFEVYPNAPRAEPSPLVQIRALAPLGPTDARRPRRALRRLAMALVGTLLFVSGGAALADSPPAAPTLTARAADGSAAAHWEPDGGLAFVRGAERVRVEVADAGSPTGLWLDAAGRFAFLSCAERERGLWVVDGHARSARLVAFSDLFGLGDRIRLGEARWHRPEGSFVAVRDAVLFVDTPIGLKAIDAARTAARSPRADELSGALSGLPRFSFPWLAALRGLSANGGRARVRAELDPLLDHLLERPHDDRELSAAVFETLATCFKDDGRLSDRATIERLLAVYLRYDRTRVRQLLSDGPGRSAIKPLRDVMDDEAAPMGWRVAAASCLMPLSSFRKSEAFEFALSRLGDADPQAREESYAVLAYFAGLELLRLRSEVESTLFAALSTDDGRGDQASRLVERGLASRNARAYAEPIVLENLAKPDLPLPARRALYRSLGVPTRAPVSARAIGERAAGDLASADEGVRAAVLAALRELRRHVDQVDEPFADADAARNWWASVARRL